MPFAETETDETLKALRRHERTVRTLGNDVFISKLENDTGEFYAHIEQGEKRLRDENG